MQNIVLAEQAAAWVVSPVYGDSLPSCGPVLMFPILTNTYFSGAGLMDIGLQSGGLTLQQSFEIEALCCDTLRRNFSHEVVQCDITKKLVSSEKECQVMVATYPCTKYSPIASIHGVRTGDDLFLHFFRHVAIRRPELYVVENVPGMKKFPVVMEAMTKLPDYYVHVACPVKSSIWLPQKRDRLIIIGSVPGAVATGLPLWRSRPSRGLKPGRYRSRY